MCMTRRRFVEVPKCLLINMQIACATMKSLQYLLNFLSDHKPHRRDPLLLALC